ncbi:MAG: hypothetical protein JWM44_1685 [Bacilli bacterium]|nr:hypothetical protein [Bacilli bacterium]
MASVIFDTNIYVFHSLKYQDALQVWNEYAVIKNYDVIMSIIQVAELLSFSKIEDIPAIKIQREKYISLADEVVLVDDEIARKAAEIKRAWNKHSGKNLKLPDALIAATAILHDAVLISNNNRDFLYLSEFHGLKYVNPILNQDDLYNFVENLKAKTE